VAVVPSNGAAAEAITISPVRMPRPMPPHVPTRMSRRAPSRSSSSTTIAADGAPIPVVWTLTGTPPYVPVYP
jgi:hypothetical protein